MDALKVELTRSKRGKIKRRAPVIQSDTSQVETIIFACLVINGEKREQRSKILTILAPHFRSCRRKSYSYASVFIQLFLYHMDKENKEENNQDQQRVIEPETNYDNNNTPQELPL